MILGMPAEQFIALAIILTTFLVAFYLILKQALVAAHFEIKDREEREEQARRGGKR